MDILVVGALGAAHALRGEITVRRFHPDSPVWRVPGRISLLLLAAGTPDKGPNGRPLDTLTLSAKAAAGVKDLGPWSMRSVGKGRVAIRCEAIPSRTAAEGLKNRLVGVAAEHASPLDDGEFYFHETPGWTVETEDGEVLGTVVRTLNTHVDLLEVRPKSGGPTWYLPVIDDVIISVDREAAKVVINLIEGLIP